MRVPLQLELGCRPLQGIAASRSNLQIPDLLCYAAADTIQGLTGNQCHKAGATEHLIDNRALDCLRAHCPHTLPAHL